jgi:exosortase
MSEKTSSLKSISAPMQRPFPNKIQFALKWTLVILPLGYLWFQLINTLRLEWETNPQYSYGLVVPLLVAGLLLRRWVNQVGKKKCPSIAKNPWPVVFLSAFLAFLFLPTRLIEEATPEWRPVQWLMGIETIGLTLYAFYLAGGKNWLRQAAFPVLFFLVAIPWPSPIEQPVIQGLSRMNASMVVQVLGILGVPAIQHGNVVEVSTGMVGINDACSGIRSFQSSLMISLFMGEFYLFKWPRRILLLLIGFVLAMAFNLFRASLLTWLAANKGMAAIAEYHDEAGFTIMLACIAGLWGAAWLLSRRKNENAGANVPDELTLPGSRIQFRLLNRFAIGLVVWLALVETGVMLWYHARESHLKPGPNWTVNFPENNPTFKALPLTTDEHLLLQFDQGKQGKWQEDDGTVWQTSYFNWLPGKVAGYLAKRHTPDICLPASGLKIVAGPKLEIITVHGVDLPMRCYVFEGAAGSVQVFQCHWEAGVDKESYTAEESARFNLIRGIWAGRGNQGQKVLEIVITGCDDPEQAKQLLERQLEKLIHVEG